jgi:beta-lactamase class A
MEALAQKMNQLCDEKPFDTYWYLKDLRTGQEIDRDGDVVIPSASTRKVAILMEALKQVNEGKLNLRDPFTIEEKYQGNTSGCFQHFIPGSQIYFQDALVMMIIVSDNTCTGKIAEIVGLDNVNALCQSLGMTGTTHREGLPVPEAREFDHPVDVTNATTARDQGILLELILRGRDDADAAAKLGCTPELCKLAIDIMSWQKMTQKLPALLPPDGSVAHKTGTGTRNANDVGIIFRNSEPFFILNVFCDGIPRKQKDGPNGQTAANMHIATLCRTAWDALVG